MFIYAIIAGFLIGIGGIVNLTIGGIGGAVFFSVGLLSILHFGLNLFTGKAGLIATNEISFTDLFKIWFGNFIGATCCAFVPIFTNRQEVVEKAMKIVEARTANGDLVNFLLGVMCGVLMYVAVTGYKDTKNVAFVILPVATFILAGFNHCVADMFYLGCGGIELTDWLTLVPTTLGNFLGCNLLPAGRYYQKL